MRRGLDKRIDYAIGEAGRRHGGGQGDENIDLIVELGMDSQSGERLRGALREANVRKAFLARGAEDVSDGVRDVMEGELVDGEVPEVECGWRVPRRFLRVLVATIVAQLNLSVYSREKADGRSAHPNVITLLDKNKGKTSLRIGQADPDLRVHEQAMVEVHDLLLDAPRSAVDFLALLSVLPSEPVHAKQEAILGLEDVLLGLVSEDAA